MKKTGLIIIGIFCVSDVFAQTHNMVVAKDGSGDYTTVQAAFDAVPYHNKIPITIFIKKGIYKEKLLLDSTKDFVTLIAENADSTILTYDDHSGKITPNGEKINTYTSASVDIRANDFTAKNIIFQNNAGFHAGQAVAVEIQGDKAAFYHCRFIGFQDVLFANSASSREYYDHCYIEGTTDFIFGNATAFFDHCNIFSKKNSHVTAASTPQDHAFGFVFKDCKLTGDSSLKNVSLGRPWRPYACVTYIHCYIGHDIKPQGWSNWNKTDNYKTARFAEYKDYGPGADISARVPWSHQLTAKQVKKYSVKNVLSGWAPKR